MVSMLREFSTDSVPEEPTIRVMDVTPEIAGDWLGNVSRNRPIKRHKIAEYAEALRRGEWRLTGETIKRDRHGRLTDGQHRCAAVVETGIAMRSAVAEGVPTEAFDVMDSGVPRSASDVLAIHGFTNTAKLAATIRYVWTFERYGDFMSHRNRRCLTLPSITQG
jgi:hypothetical protein